jgi:hypothetical protein
MLLRESWGNAGNSTIESSAIAHSAWRVLGRQGSQRHAAATRMATGIIASALGQSMSVGRKSIA